MPNQRRKINGVTYYLSGLGSKLKVQAIARKKRSEGKKVRVLVVGGKSGSGTYGVYVNKL